MFGFRIKSKTEAQPTNFRTMAASERAGAQNSAPIT
jgi:hypothetical protein